MGFFDAVSRRIWNDEKFLALSDDAKLLFFRMLTGPEKLPIPGVIVAGEAQLAEAMKWLPERFRERFSEIEDAGMLMSNLAARLTWLPNAMKHRGPANPNVGKGWMNWEEMVPECELKDKIEKHLIDYLTARGKAFLNAWTGTTNRSRNGLRNGPRNGLANGRRNKEKEEEEEKEKQKDYGEEVAPPSTSRAGPTLPQCVDRFLKLAKGKKPEWAEVLGALQAAHDKGVSTTTIMTEVEREGRDLTRFPREMG